MLLPDFLGRGWSRAAERHKPLPGQLCSVLPTAALWGGILHPEELQHWVAVEGWGCV